MEIKDLVKGQYFKIPTSNAVYVRAEYDRKHKKFMATRFDDISSSRLFKRNQPVIVDFDF